jgi:phage gp36-like protein
MVAYATYADLENALDAQIVAGLCGDGGQPMPGPNPVTESALERATATVRSYIRVGGIYSEDEIGILHAAADPLLVMLVVDLATEMLFQRRGAKITPAIEQRLKQAYTMLEALRDGKQLFGSVESNVRAGTPKVTAVPPANLAWYNAAANSPFFPPRRGSTYP